MKSIIGLTLWLLCLGQNALAGDIRWRSGTESTPAKSAPEIESSITALAKRSNVRHVVVQLAETPEQNKRAQLEGSGLKLLSYLGNHAFFAALDPAANALAITRTAGIGDVQAIQRKWKLHPTLDAGVIPDWSVVEKKGTANPTVGAYMLLHPDVPIQPDGLAVVQRHGAVVRAELATVNGLVIELPFANIAALADEDAVQWVEPPLPKLSETNDSNRLLTQAESVQAAPYVLNGSGVNILVYDGGTAHAAHQDFGARLFVRDNSGTADHATHVAGTIGGNGAASGGLRRGMAPGVTLQSYGVQGSDLYTNPGDIEADYNQAINAYGSDIANNSIGTNVALNGLPCNLEGDYGVTDSVIDSIVRGSLGVPFRIVWANGNERGPGTCGTAYSTTAPPACAKNHITVGAVNSNDDTMTNFSSWGPTDDGRLKPDICAPGCQSNDDLGVTSTSCNGDGDPFDQCDAQCNDQCYAVTN